MKRLFLIKFSRCGQVFAYSGEDPAIVPGDGVLAETGQGLGLARVIVVRELAEGQALPEDVVAIERRATAEDLTIDTENRKQVERARDFAAARIRERGLDMKLVNVEGLFDRSKLIFYFTAPTRIDFRELVKELVREYHTRIELRQIGVRHETQMLGAIGSCGMVCCCRQFLHKFVPVTIKMAKEQNLFLNPTKISGICGRLLCCLSYEQDNYDAFHRACPKLGKRYQTKDGLLKILRANMFRGSVAVLDEKNEERELTLDEWNALEPNRTETVPPVAPPAVPEGVIPPRQAVMRMPQNELMVVAVEPEMDEGSLDTVLDSAFASAAVEDAPQTPRPPDGAPRRKRRRRK